MQPSIPQVIPGYADGNFWRSARSSCCGTWLVYWEPKLDLWVHWAGWDAVPEGGLACRRCESPVLVP